VVLASETKVVRLSLRESTAFAEATPMSIPFHLIELFVSHLDEDTPFSLEDVMEMPPCPVCKEGRLLPFSDEKKPFAFWICSLPSCSYAMSRNLTAETYYKGAAASEVKEKGSKNWIEFRF